MRPLVFAVLAGLCLGACSTNQVETTVPTDPGTEPPGRDAGTDIGPPIAATQFAQLRVQNEQGDRWYVDGTPDTASVALGSVPGHNAFWFAWSVFHPGTDVWRGDTIADATVNEDPSGDCTVPCSNIFQGCGGGLDCIPPIDDPKMVEASSPEAQYLADADLVLGVRTSEGPRAYPHNILWWHEVTNEVVGGDAYTITLCPLTGSGLAFDRTGFVEGETVRLGVSGLLYNSNLVMWDRETQTFWSQMRLEALSGPELRSRSPLRAVSEMTWSAWRALHPDTLVMSDQTGFSRDYQSYPYTRGGMDYRINDDDTFSATEPLPDPQFDNKDMVFGLVTNDTVKGYVWETLESEVGARRGVIQDTVGGTTVNLVFDLDSAYVHAFDGSAGSLTLVDVDAP